MRGLHIIFQYSTTQPSTPSQPTIIIQRWICQKIYTETSPLMLLTTWLQRTTMMTTVFLASWQQKLTLTIFLHRTEAASSIIACLIHSSNLLQLNHFETHPSELQGDTNLFLAILIYKSTQGISNNSRVFKWLHSQSETASTASCHWCQLLLLGCMQWLLKENNEVTILTAMRW